MFDLEEQIAKWRQEMAATGLAPEILTELEGHLREDIERQVRGVDAAEAFQVAVGRIGPAKALKREFNLARRAGVLATLWRHKWKLAICSGAGLLAAAGLYVLRPAEYESQTQIFVKYATLREPGVASEPRENGITKARPDTKLAAMMQTEKERLMRPDLWQHVARSIGPEKILRKAGGGDELKRATAMVGDGLHVVVPPNSSLIVLGFRHPDPELLQPILSELVRRYLTERKASLSSEALAVRPQVGSVLNIAHIQRPSAPRFDSARKLSGLSGIFMLGVLAGFAWVVLARVTESKLQPAR